MNDHGKTKTKLIYEGYKRLLFTEHQGKHFFLKGKVFLLKAENSCHIPRHINCLVIFQQGAQTHQRKMLEHIQILSLRNTDYQTPVQCQ